METSFDGVRVWESKITEDSRGEFRKILPPDLIKEIKYFELSDAFVTYSVPNVVRGMHLQIGEAAGKRIIHVLDGEIEDVLLDLREGSGTYGNIFSTKLKRGAFDTILVPAGVAHGFAAKSATKVLYLADKLHDPEKDTGFNPLTIGHDWRIQKPILSSRDRELPAYEG